MKRLSILLAAALLFLFAPGALAQQHDHGGHDAPTTEADAPDMAHMMAMHERMMADSSMHRRMMADPEMRAMMEEMMGGEMDMDAMHAHMAAMPPAERQAHMRQMRARMVERMEAMDPERRRTMHERMRAMHERMMADPEMRERMEGMDHGGMDHSAGVAMQRRNAGARLGDERPATPTVGQAELDASETADRFHAALAAGDRQTVEALLAPDAVVLESGRAEARNEYLGGHFARDTAFLADARPEPLFRRTTVAGDAAWVASTQRIGDAQMAELLVMKRGVGGWQISAVHWSSAR